MKEKNRLKREVSRRLHSNDRSTHRKDQNNDGSSLTVRSASSLESSITFSSTVLARMLAKEGVTAGKDFEIEQKSPKNCTHPVTSSEAPKSPTKENAAAVSLWPKTDSLSVLCLYHQNIKGIICKKFI